MENTTSFERQTGALKTMLDGFPDIGLLGDSDDEYGASGDKGGRGRAGEPLTPPLSLPDSFDDGEYEGGGHQERERGKKSGFSNSGGGASFGDIARLKSLLVERNEKFRDLNISENLYNDLRLRSEADLSLFELAQLKSHEFTISTRREVEKLRRNLQDTGNELISAQSRGEEASAQLSRLSKRAVLDSDSARMEIATLEERCARLTVRLKDETTMRQEGEEKASQFDRQLKELQQTQKEFSALKVLYEQQASSLAQLTVSAGASRTAERDLERAKEILSLDKAHLLQELRASEALAQQLSKSAESSASKALSLEMKNQTLAEQLLHVQLNGNNGVEARLEKETARIREEALTQVEHIKTASREMMDRENKVLREAKVSAEGAQEQLKRSVDFLSTENTRLQTELVQAQARAASDIAELRADLKLKTFEISILGSATSEKMGLYRQMEAQLETTKGELHVHRQAFLRLESESEIAVVELRAQLQAAKSRLAAYEALENEIDQAVLRVAQAGQIQSGEAGASPLNDAIDKENVGNVVSELTSGNFFMTMKNMPSHPERRARQAVLLAQKVLETERQRDELQTQLTAMKASLATHKEAKIEAENALKRTAQPTVYLVTKLRDEEAAHQQCRAQLKEQDAVVRRALQQKDKLVADNEAIRERMRLMLQQRGEIDQLRGLLETLQAPESGSADAYRSNVAPRLLADESVVSVNEDTSGFDRRAEDEVAPVQTAPASVMAAVVNKPANIDTGASSIALGSQVPTPTAAHSQTFAPIAPEQAPLNIRAKSPSPSPEQLARMTASPTAAAGSGRSGKWHSREEL